MNQRKRNKKERRTNVKERKEKKERHKYTDNQNLIPSYPFSSFQQRNIKQPPAIMFPCGYLLFVISIEDLVERERWIDM